MTRLLAKCVHDLALLISPADLQAAEMKLEKYAEKRFKRFVESYYTHLLSTLSHDESNAKILREKPWLIQPNDSSSTELIISAQNIKACGGVLNHSQKEMRKRILKVVVGSNESPLNLFSVVQLALP